MQIVSEALARPHHCAVLPFVGGPQPDGYFDAGLELGGVDPHVYVSVKAVREMARLLGFKTVEEHQEVLDAIAEADARVEALEAEVAEADKTAQAIDRLQKVGFRAQKKPGRKSTKEVEA